MANIVAIVGNIGTSNNKVHIDGSVFVSPNVDAIGFSLEANWNDIAIDINNAIKQAAIGAAEALGHSIGVLDKKTLFGGAVDV